MSPEDVINANEKFLRDLYLDPNRIMMYLRNGALVNDHDETILRLTPTEKKRERKPWKAYLNKIQGLFCSVCMVRADGGLCQECGKRIVTELRDISEDTV